MNNENIAKMVTRNIVFNGNTPAKYTIIDCFNGNLSLESIKNIARAVNNRLKKMTTDDLFDSKPNRKTEDLKLVVDTLVEVVEHKEKMAEAAEKRASTIAENRKRLETLKAIRTEKEIEGLKGKKEEDLDKMIADLEATV